MSEITYETNPIGAYDQEINRLEELNYTLGSEFIDQPNKEFLALDLWKFLEDFPSVKADIDHFIRYRLSQLRTRLKDKEVQYRYIRRIRKLEQQLKEKENGKGKH